MNIDLRADLNALQDRGVRVVDPRQTYLDDDVKLDRIHPGVVLHPGTRLLGARTFLGPGAKIGIEGPAVLQDTVVGANVEIGSGYLSGSVLLRDSRVGPNAYLRPGCLLEEEASTGHAVGLKHTILMSFITLGSLINFCDGLISGGTSRRDHSEVGSGFIHFNYTPWGKGDKATPSLVGDVARGALLREPRIFLGGLSGLVGPQKVGFGSLTVAGQVIRKEIAPHRLVCEIPKPVDKPFDRDKLNDPAPVIKANLEYIGQLLALQAWYRDVRLARIPSAPEYQHLYIVASEATALLSICIEERIGKLQELFDARQLGKLRLSSRNPSCPLQIDSAVAYIDHVQWVRSLSEDDVQRCITWLQSIVDSVEAS